MGTFNLLVEFRENWGVDNCLAMYVAVLILVLSCLKQTSA